MKLKPLQNNQILLKAPSSLCCCTSEKKTTSTDIHTQFKDQMWFTGAIDTPAGPVPQASTRISFADTIGHIRARASSFRMKFSIKPGLYAVGNPDSSSDIFVTANYRLSFDHLRKSLKDMNAWILVLDTAGINVWCAAGKGTFGTDELVKRIKLSEIGKCVEHRMIILPQLGAPGINSAEVQRATGFRVNFGPVRADDIKRYIEKGYKADENMRLVQFRITDRAVLIPMEINMIKGKLVYFILAALLYSALQPEGIIFSKMTKTGYPLLSAGLISVFAGAVVTPLLLPFIPFRSFAIKGGLTGAALLLITDYFTGIFRSTGSFMYAAIMVLFTLISSYIALQFTGATTFTSLSGVKREIRYSLPVYITGAFASALLLVIFKINEWGYL